MTGGTGANVDKLPKGSLLCSSNLTGAMAMGTSIDGSARFRLIAVTAGTGLGSRNLNIYLGTKGRFNEIYLQIIAQICTPGGAAALPASSHPAAKEHVEDVSQIVKATEATKVKTTGATGTVVVKGRMAKLIISSSSLLITEHLIGLCGLFEFLLSIGIISIDVGMILTSQPPIGLFNFIGTGRTIYP